MMSSRGGTGKPGGPSANNPASARGALASIRYILIVFGAVFLAATVLCGWLLVTSQDAVFVVFGSAALVVTAGTGLAVRAVRVGLAGLSIGAAGAPQVVRAQSLARTATTGLLFGAWVPVLVALGLVFTHHANAAWLIVSVMAALVLVMASMVVGTCRTLLNRASASG